MSADVFAQMVDDLWAQHTELEVLLVECEPDEWHASTRCEGWDVADVVLHMAQTNELAIASATGRFAEVADDFATAVVASGDADAVRSVDDAAAVRVALERGGADTALLARWERSGDELRDALLACDPHARVQWVAGELSVLTLATTRLAETWIHTGDVAEAVGVELVPSERLRAIARLAWRTLPYAFERAGRAMSGPVAFMLTGPNGDAWSFTPADDAVTVIRGSAAELCAVAARRVAPCDTALVGEGPDADALLELVRTYA
ncbi:MAG TPA: maleylpyruvate isomerase family mycothiol-dependent enzyme [Acidimicrobiia bacterium]|jgi:uncharacterized protein (TIGR03084 family)